MVGRGTRLSPETIRTTCYYWISYGTQNVMNFVTRVINLRKCRSSAENDRKYGKRCRLHYGYRRSRKNSIRGCGRSERRSACKTALRNETAQEKAGGSIAVRNEYSSGRSLWYVPAFGWEMAPPFDKQKQTLEKLGILPDAIENAGKASKILDRLDKRRREGLTTPKQIRFLESRGFQHVGTWQFETAKNMIDRIAGNGWRVPNGINPAEYRG